MSAFTLDTSGQVAVGEIQVWGALTVGFRDLSPFAQGYVEALLRSCTRTDHKGVVHEGWAAIVSPGMSRWRRIGFSDLSPEAIAQVFSDCEVMARRAAYMVPADARQGAIAWDQRQRGDIPDFPPLTVALSDAGKVVFL